MASSVDLDKLKELAAPLGARTPAPGLAPLGQRIAVAKDTAFGFSYPHVLAHWQRAGAEIIPFSPLADEPPDDSADAVMLPGGYPELHAGVLSGNTTFFSGLRNAARRQALIYGEMRRLHGAGRLHDRQARRAPWPWPGFCPWAPALKTAGCNLGYRSLEHDGALPWPRQLKGHEFHYSTIDWQGPADNLFKAEATAGADLGAIGLRMDTVMGSYAHVIAAAG